VVLAFRHLDSVIWVSGYKVLMEMKKVMVSSKLGRAVRSHSHGFTLIEVLIALALFAIIGIVFAGGLATASRAVLTADVRTNAESLARTQMESVKEQDYIDYSEPGHDQYDEIVGESESYDIDMTVEPLNPETYEPYECDEDTGVCEYDDGIQLITVTVGHDGRQVITLVGYKINR
jgi:prepilin-type N-terminal cleavage/methylation domain-containing protein